MNDRNVTVFTVRSSKLIEQRGKRSDGRIVVS
jgi:hypothetical protein